MRSAWRESTCRSACRGRRRSPKSVIILSHFPHLSKGFFRRASEFFGGVNPKNVGSLVGAAVHAGKRPRAPILPLTCEEHLTAGARASIASDSEALLRDSWRTRSTLCQCRRRILHVSYNTTSGTRISTPRVSTIGGLRRQRQPYLHVSSHAQPAVPMQHMSTKKMQAPTSTA